MSKLKRKLFIIAEIESGRVAPVTLELAAFAEEIASGGIVKTIVIESQADKHAEYIAEETGFDVISVTTPFLDSFNASAIKKILYDILEKEKPSFILMANTPKGRDIAPGLACRLNSACISGVTGVMVKEGALSFQRNLHGGKINADIIPLVDSAVLTVMPGEFNPKIRGGKKGSINSAISDEEPAGSILCDTKRSEPQRALLAGARTVVSIGRGIGDVDNILLAKRFTGIFKDSALACSRPVVDLGWMKYKYQVGITGAVISPEIYIACGISGSTQHIAGMKGSELVISINNDPAASIFNFSDICIVDNMINFFKAFEDIVND